MADEEFVSARRPSDDGERVVFGSNTIHTAARSVTVDGRRMWAVTDGPEPCLRSPIFDATGVLLASIDGDRVCGPEAERFRLTTSPGRWDVWDSMLGTHVFSGSLETDGTLRVERADFYGVNGSHVVVTDELVVYTHCPVPPDCMETDLRSIFLLADCELHSAEGVILGGAGFARGGVSSAD